MFFSYKKPEEVEGDFAAYLSNLHELRIENKQYLNHQSMITRYLSPYTPYQSLLVFHETGSGKSALCISVFQELYRFHQGQLIFIYMVNNNSAKKNFREEVDKFLSNQPDYKQDNIFIIVYSNEEIQRLKNHIKTFVVEKKLPILIVIDEAHNLVTNDTIEVKTPDNDKLNMIKKYIERTNGHSLDIKSLKSILKTVYSSKQKISKEEKILNDVIEYMRDKVEKNHTFMFKWELASIMKITEVNEVNELTEVNEVNDNTTNKNRTKKEERYYNIVEYMKTFESNGFQIPVMDIVHRLGRYFHKKKKTTKELIRELNDYLNNVAKDQVFVSKKDIELIIQQEQSDKRYAAVDNFLNSFLPDIDKTVLVMSATPMCHMVQELIPLLNLVIDNPEDKVALDVFVKDNWREILAKKIKGKVSYFKRTKVGTCINASFLRGDESFDQYNRNMFHNVFFQQMDELQSRQYLNALLSNNKSLNKHIHRYAVITDDENMLRERLKECKGNVDKMLGCIREHSVIYYTIIHQLLNEPNKRTFIYGKYILDNVDDFSGLSGFCELLSYFNIKRFKNFERDYQTEDRFYVKLFETDRDFDGNQRTEEVENEMRKKNNQQLVRDFNRLDKINIIVGSDASSEALTFLDIERIHVIDPWWNLARAHQVLGRGIRHRSHDRLLKNHRFKEIFVKTSHDNIYLQKLLNESVKISMIEYLNEVISSFSSITSRKYPTEKNKSKELYLSHLEQIQSDSIVDVKVVHDVNHMMRSKNGKGYDFFIQFEKTPLDIYHVGTYEEKNRIDNIHSLIVLNLNDRTNKRLKERFVKLQIKYANIDSNNKSEKRRDAEIRELKELKKKEQDTLKYESAPSLYQDKTLIHDFLEIVYRTCYTKDVKAVSTEDWDAMMMAKDNDKSNYNDLIPIRHIENENLQLIQNTDNDISIKVYDIKDIPLNIYLHCAMPNMQQYNQILTDVMKSNGKLFESQKIYQLHQYERASEREKAICHVTGFLIEHSIDLYLNPYDYSKDLYLPSFYKNKLEQKKKLYRQQKNSTNYDIIDSSKNSVLEVDPVYDRVREYIDVFFKRRNNNAIMITSLWNTISKECNLTNKIQFRRYILKLRSTNSLYYKMGYIKLHQNDNAKVFGYNDSVLQKKVHDTIEYNLDSIKNVLNVSNKVKLLNQYCNIEDNNNDLSKIGKYLSVEQEQEQHTTNCNNDDDDGIKKRGQKRHVQSLIESLPSEKRQKILKHTMSSSSSTSSLISPTSQSNQKQSILESLVKDPRYVELDASLERKMIGIQTKQKYYVYILNDNINYTLNESSLKLEMNEFTQSFSKKHRNSFKEVVSTLESFLQRDVVVENWKNQIYPVILRILQNLESSVLLRNKDISSFIQLSFDEKLKYVSNKFDKIILKDYLIDDKKEKIFQRLKKKLIDYASLETKSDFIRIRDRQIQGTTFFYQISIWIVLMRINCCLGVEPFDNNSSNNNKRKWLLFFKKYLIDKRVESSGRDINTLFFPNMFELLMDPSFFSEQDLLPIDGQLKQYVEYTKSDSTKTEMLQGVKIKHWRNFLKKCLENKNLVFSFD